MVGAENPRSLMTVLGSACIIELCDVYKAFKSTDVLKGISLSVREGEVICIIGPSGSGKSTLLRCINGLVKIDKGTIKIGTLQLSSLNTEAQWLPVRRQI